jgi:hypothetical protein
MSHVYGDSTTFPYDVDYIELSRHAVDCAVQLFSAQHAISAAMERSEGISESRAVLLTRLSGMSQAVQDALGAYLTADSEQTARVAERMLESVKTTAEEELAELERQGTEAAAHTRNVVSRTGEAAQRALEGFLLRHDLPGSQLALNWSSAGEQSYTGQVSVKTPLGVNAAFSLAIPPEHAWGRARRVADLAPGLEVHFPQQSGWLSKRVEMAAVKLDRMFLSAVRFDAGSAEFRLRKAAAAGSGYRVLVDLEGDHRVTLEPLGEDGSLDADPPMALDGEDSAQMFRLCSRVLESMQTLWGLRRGLVSVDLDGQPLDEMAWPEVVAERLLSQLAPVVNEIARRSGAPGELVLRRDVGGGRREEVYVTKAELYEKILVLPPARRVSFERLGLSEPLLAVAAAAPALPAPAPSRGSRALAAGTGTATAPPGAAE